MLAIHHRGPVAPFPQGSAAAAAVIEVLDILAPSRLNRLADTVLVGGRGEQMDVFLKGTLRRLLYSCCRCNARRQSPIIRAVRFFLLRVRDMTSTSSTSRLRNPRPITSLIFAILLSSLMACSLTPPTAPVNTSPQGVGPLGPEMLDTLRRGGYTLFMVHPELNPGHDEPGDGTWWKDCVNTLDLSKVGKETAATVGKAMRRLVIPFQVIRSGEFCRSLNTAAYLGLTRHPPEQFPALNTLAAQTSAGIKPAESAAYLTAMLAQSPSTGFNFLVISDAPDPTISPTPELAMLRPGETAVLKPGDGGKIIFVARLSPGDWQAAQYKADADAEAAAKAKAAATAAILERVRAADKASAKP